MCSVVFAYRPGEMWPLILAANRDEMADRPSRPPGRHWPEFPHVVAGMDEQAGGSWLGINDEGVVAAVMNRRGTLGPAEGKRSRGELVLEALGHADAVEAVDNMRHLLVESWRPFNMLIADNRDVFVLHSRGDGRLQARPVDTGVWMLTSGELNDLDSPRIAHYLPLYRAADIPDPMADDWGGWQDLLLSKEPPFGCDAAQAMFVETGTSFGTVSSSLLALRAADAGGGAVWRFREAGESWRPVTLDI